MRFSRRPTPMDFGALENDFHPAEVSGASSLESVGFRPVDPVEATYPNVFSGCTSVSPHVETHDHPVHDLEETRPSGWPIWLVATAVAALWALAPIAFAVGYRNGVAPLQHDIFALAVFASLVAGPAIFVLGAAYMIRQGQKLGFESRRAKSMADEMLSPALLAAARAGDVTLAVREEIVRAAGAADDARETLIAMRDALAFETEKLTGATAQSVRTTQELATTLGRERSEMSGLSQRLDAQATKVTDAIGQQAKMVAEATGIAETQIRDAEAGLSARAADLAAAAGAAGDAARTAGEDLTRHIARLEAAGAGVAEQVRAVETGLTEHRTSLVALSQTLKVDHAALATNAETHAARLGEFITSARQSAEALSEQASAGGASVSALIADAAVQLRDLVETAKAEREEFGQSTFHSIEAVSAATNAHRSQLEAQTRAAVDALAEAAEVTRTAAAEHAASAREQVDRLSEAAFSAGQQANQVFEARMEEARALVDQSSKMVVETGDITAVRLEAGAASARATLDQLSDMLSDLEARATQLPTLAQEHIEQVRAAVSQGMDELLAQARRTADETRTIDAELQKQAQQNFELLADVARRLNSATASAVEPPDRKPGSSHRIPVAGTRSAEVGPGLELEPFKLEDPASEAAEASAAAVLATRIGLRNRIRLTPIASDQEFSTVFEAAAGLPAPGTARDDDDDAHDGEAWTWKDFLASLDGSDGAREAMDEMMATDLSRMGVDSAKLLPRSRVEQIATALQTGDVDGAREVVRSLAPAATRRIARRMFTDDDVKRRTEAYLRRYKIRIDDAVSRDPAAHLLTELFCTEAGRIYLLLDTAAGDMI